MHNSKLGDYLRNCRGNESLRVFAKKVGISHTYLDNIEKGIDRRTNLRVSPTVALLVKVADNIGTDRNELIHLAIMDCMDENMIAQEGK